MIRNFYTHSRVIFLMLALIFIAGIYSYIAIPKESDPDINIPIIYVSMMQRGITPEDSEGKLVKPMEQELSSIEGVIEMRSTAYQGGGNVILEFDAGFDSKKALQDVRDKVAIAKSELPDAAEEPRVKEINFSQFPILVITLSGQLPERVLVEAARNLQDQLETLPMVLEATISGERIRQVEIIVSPLTLDQYEIDAQELLQLFINNNRLMAAGFQEQGDDRFYIKIPSLVEDYQDLLNMPVKIYQNRAITLGDIATIRNTYRDREVYPRLNGQDSIAINVSKRSGFSIIDTVAYLKQFMVVAQKHLPPGITVTFSQDKSSYIKTMLSDLQNNIASAIILVLIIIVAVLGVRSGLLVGISIPSSFMLALIALYASGVSVNVVVLFSLILSAGLIVDSVIVVTEFANRMMQRGFSKVEAYLTSVKRMAAPIIASTMTTLAAFLPLLFWPDVTGQFMQYMPITLLMTLTASLIMGLVFLPIIGCYIGGIGNDAPKAGAYHDYADVKDLKGFIGHYVALLTYVVTRPKRIVFSAVAFMVTILTLYGFFNHGVKFFPAIEPDLATVKVLARGNLSLDAKDAIIRPIEEKLIASGYYDSVYTRSGYRDTRNDAQDVIGSMQIAFKDWDQRPPVAEIIDQILAINQDLVGAYLEVSVQRAGPQQGKPVNLIIKADAVSSLEDAARDVLLRMAKLGVFTNIDSTMAYQNIEWEYDIDKVEAAKYGITLNNIGQLMRLAGSGLVIDDYSPDDYDDNVDVTARFSQEYRNIDILKNLKVATNRGMQPISLFVTRKPVLRSSEINRVDRDRVVRIKSDVQQGVLATNAIDMLMQDIALKPLAQGASIILKGDQEKQNKAADFLVKAFIVAVFLILMILLIQFNSFYAVLLILSAVILSTGGVLIGLLLTQQPFIIVMGGVGVISLAGIVVNNNIVLIDTFKTHLKRDDVSVFEAIIITGVQRLRPILLTTVTTILGLLPMVLQLNINFVAREVSLGAPSTQWWVQLATCISFGLAIATIVTLVLTPALIAWRYCKR